MPLLSVRDLNVSIGAADILKSLSLQVDAGEVLGIAGESGSGKTMLAMAIAGLLPEGAERSGEITFDNKALLELSEAALCTIRGKDIGVVFQEPMTALNPLMTIGAQVAETVRLHRKVTRKEAQQIARETLDKVGLPAGQFSMDRYPHNLSGGQRQRVAIAIAVAMKPKLLIADEPTTALDVTTQAEIMALFRKLVDTDGVALILVTHDLAVVAETADRVVVMKHGDIVDQGDVMTVFRASPQPYTSKLIHDSVRAPGKGVKRDVGAAAVLDVRNIVREYAGARRLFGARDSFRAVDDVSLEIFPNENVGLVGESGCGKSTLLRTILGLDHAQSGEIRVFGQRFPVQHKAEARAVRRQLQVVFQDPFGTFNPRWRVRDLISENFHLFDSRPSGAEARQRVDRILEQVGLQSADGERYPHEFSGGQRQRIAIARALITEPSIIVLDEAVSALDVSIRARVLDLLVELSERLGVSYLFVTHDLSVVRSVTDRVLVMQRGRIVEQGITEDVFANPSHPYTSELLSVAPDLDRALANRMARTPLPAQ